MSRARQSSVPSRGGSSQPDSSLQRSYYPPMRSLQSQSARYANVENVEDYYERDQRQRMIQSYRPTSAMGHVHDQISMSSGSSRSLGEYKRPIAAQQTPQRATQRTASLKREVHDQTHLLSTPEILQQNADSLVRLQKTWDELDSVQQKLEKLRSNLAVSSAASPSARGPNTSFSSTTTTESSGQRRGGYRAKDRSFVSEETDLSSVISDVPSGLFTGEDDDLTKRALKEYYRRRKAGELSDRLSFSSHGSSSVKLPTQKPSQAHQSYIPPRPQSRFENRRSSRNATRGQPLDDDASVSLSNLSDDLKREIMFKTEVPPYKDIALIGRSDGQKTAQPKVQQSQQIQPKAHAASSSEKKVQKETQGSPKPQKEPTQFRSLQKLDDYTDDESNLSFVSDLSQAITDTSVDTMERVKIDLEDMRLALCYSRSLPDDKRQQFFEEFAQYFNFSNRSLKSENDPSNADTRHEINRLKVQKDDSSSVAASESFLEDSASVQESVDFSASKIPTAMDVKKIIEQNATDERRLLSVIEILRRIESGQLRKLAEKLLIECRSPQKPPLSRSPHVRTSPQNPESESSSTRKLPPRIVSENFFVKNLELNSPNTIKTPVNKSQSSLSEESSSHNTADDRDLYGLDEFDTNESYEAESVDESQRRMQKESARQYDYSETADSMSTKSSIISNTLPTESEDSSSQVSVEITTPTTEALEDQYASEIEENEVIIHKLKKAIDFMVDKNIQVFSKDTLLRLYQMVAEETSKRIIAHSPSDYDLGSSIKSLFLKYTNRQVKQVRAELTQKVSDILYDEMIYNKVVHQVDKSYQKEIEELHSTQIELASEVTSLVKQKEKDLKRLHSERKKRLREIDEPTSPGTGMINRFREALLKSSDDISGYTTDESSNLPASEGVDDEDYDEDEYDEEGDDEEEDEEEEDEEEEDEEEDEDEGEEGDEVIGIDDLPDAPLFGFQQLSKFKEQLKKEREREESDFIESLPKPREGDGLAGGDADILDPSQYESNGSTKEAWDVANRSLLVSLLNQFQAGNIAEESDEDEDEDEEEIEKESGEDEEFED